MRYSDDIIEEVIHRTNIVDLIGADVRLKRAGSNYTGLCPFHAEKTPSFSVSPSKQMYYCFGCHAGGNAITYMMEYHNYTFVEALKILAERAGIQLPEEALSEEQREASLKKARLLDIYKKAASFYYYRLKNDPKGTGLRYLTSRGLSEDTIRRFGLGFADQFGDSLYRYLKQKDFSDEDLNESGLFQYDEKKGVRDRFWNRVMFPITDIRGRVIGFGGRVLGDGKPKYLNSPETFLFNKRKNLYALQYAKSSRERAVILCEGYMDVITMHQAGFTNACASLGTALTAEQCALLARYTDEVLLLYDSDEAGVNAALRALPLLKEAGLRARVANLAPHKDPDELIRKEGAETLRERLKEAENGFLFEAEILARSTDLTDPALKTEFQHELARRLLAFPEELERNNYLEALSARYGIPKDAMKKLVSAEASKGTPAYEYRKPKSGQEAPVRDDAYLQAQKRMLGFLAEYPEAYGQIRDLIHPSDFQDPVCGKMAEVLFRQLDEGRVSEAGIIAQFPDGGEERQAAAIFHTEIPAQSGAELDRAFTDSALIILREANDARLREADITDMNVFGRYIETKKMLEQFERGKVLHLPWKEQ